jgi:hypothetical protein
MSILGSVRSMEDAQKVKPDAHQPEPYVITCEDCGGGRFLLLRREGDIRFQCADCGAHYVDDEGFGRP